MTEDETRAELIDPKLRLSGWEMEDAKVNRNFPITAGRCCAFDSDGGPGLDLCCRPTSPNGGQ